MQSFGTVIRRARLARGWSQDYVGSRTRAAKGYISGMENQKTNPGSAGLVVRLAKLFGLDEKDLLLRAEIEKAPVTIRAELKKRCFGEARGMGIMAAKRKKALRKKAWNQIKAAFLLIEEASSMLADG